MLVPFTKRNVIPLRGGMVSVRNPAQLESGMFSTVMNMRGTHPGFEKRAGQIKQHSSADGTNKVLTLHQFIRNRPSESHFFAQFSDSDIHEAETAPPDTTDGSFGTEVFSGTASPKPATWASVADLLVMSNGVDQHKIYAGQDQYVKKLIVYDHTTDPPNIPTEGYDYTRQVTDDSTSSVAELDGLGTNSNQCVFICCHTPANRLTFTVSKPNGNDVSAELHYRKKDGTWADTDVTGDANDGTNSGTTTLAATESMYWSPPSNEVPWYMYGESGFWYRLNFDAALDGEVEVSSVTYGTDHDGAGSRTSFLDVVNVWDGLPVDAIEVQVYDNSTSAYNVFGAYSVALGSLSFDENDKIYLSSVDPLCGVYLDPGSTPNTDDTAAAAINTVKYWDGDGWQSLSNVSDSTVGSGSVTLSSAGWITWGRPDDEEPQMFNGTQYYAYWYEIILTDSVSTDVIVSIRTMPYFDIEDWGTKGYAACAWQDRMVYASDRWGQFLYVSSKNEPLMLNGIDYAPMEAGDGRSNQVLAMDKLFNELIAWQEEKGIEGGCTTLLEGWSPRTYGKLVLSTRIGILNSKCHAVVDGVLTSTATEEKIKTLAFWLSRYGVCVSDGRSVSIISDDIQNYFDPLESDCIRRGYEDEHWLAYDSAYNGIRVGLVSGSSATVPNKFFFFDMADKCWYEDDLAQELSCVTEVEAGSEAVPITQVGGGVDDGTVYVLNTGTNDVSTAISSYIDMEFNGLGYPLVLDELLVQCEAQTAGDISLTISGNSTSEVTETLSMTAEDTGDDLRRNQLSLNVINQWVTLRMAHSTADQSMSLYGIGLAMSRWDKN